ncbi:hypothetical protein ZIOFF_062512 [Zingiber officinale]|uniref:PAS domain-containing protein n=1 Tax=Zingiber officinale TaxID=94328 RepID=A0A8J5F5H7_ZINOF|nr:hypothetical protein ZIOFF_062512 [Zingiber officinale]
MADGSFLEELLKRFSELELRQARLRDQLQLYLVRGAARAAEAGHDDRHGSGSPGRSRSRPLPEGSEAGGSYGLFPGRFHNGPYCSVLRHIGHALHIYHPHSGVIIFWNQSAESLYGWADHEALGRNVGDLLIHEDNDISHLKSVVEMLNNGQPWSGHLAFKKRSGEMVPAMVTKTPLYEDGVFVGVITVSSDASSFHHDKHSEELDESSCQKLKAPKLSSRSRSCGEVNVENQTSRDGNMKTDTNEIMNLPLIGDVPQLKTNSGVGLSGTHK